MKLNANNMTKHGNARMFAILKIKVQAQARVRDDNDLAPVKMRRSSSQYKPRVKHPAEALAPTTNIWTQDLYDGAELRPFTGRHGSMDAYKLPSLGSNT